MTLNSKGYRCVTVFYTKENLLVNYIVSRCGKSFLFYTSFVNAKILLMPEGVLGDV